MGDDSDSFEDCVEEQTKQADLPLDQLKQWIKDHKKFPKNIPDVVLKRFLKVCDNDLQETQNLLLLNFKLRSGAPNLFTNRDILSKELQTASQVLRMCPLQTLTRDRMQVTFGGINDPDPNKFVYTDCIKMALMLFDTRFCFYDNNNEQDIADGEIVVMDMGGITFRHFFKMVRNLPTAKFYMHFMQEASPIRIQQVNIVNPSPIIDKIFTLFKPFMKKEVVETVAFHRNLETLHERVGKEYLPEKYGGTNDIDIEEQQAKFMNKVENFRHFMIEDDNWRLAD